MTRLRKTKDVRVSIQVGLPTEWMGTPLSWWDVLKIRARCIYAAVYVPIDRSATMPSSPEQDDCDCPICQIRRTMEAFMGGVQTKKPNKTLH